MICRQSAVNMPNSGLFSQIRGGAGSFLKNLKDTSNRVMQTVQSWVLIRYKNYSLTDFLHLITCN